MDHSNDLEPFYKLKNKYDETLIFESRFESGNLHYVIQSGRYEYDLYLNPDSKTDSYTEWSYFRIQNTRCHIQYTFNITNFHNSDNLYNQGMLPLVYSRKDYEKHNLSWQRDGSNVACYQDLDATGDTKLNYILTFNLTFKYDNDEVYIAH